MSDSKPIEHSRCKCSKCQRGAKLFDRFVGAFVVAIGISEIVSWFVEYHFAHLLIVPAGMMLGWFIIVRQQRLKEEKES
jgi:hypothetical protein